ncbi:MAG: Si-specific NAD(P)(+) transhydrogenase [Actinomycetota bacterium]|nr:Si-specific NAD(P)(+) transhydrogenase [Actinomycetota bacterium]
MATHYELVVIGAGPAGEKAAAQAAYHGHSVAIIERSAWVGGSAVGSAGVPTKTLRETALYVTGFRRRDVYGVAPDVDATGVVRHLRERTREVSTLMERTVRHNIERHGIDLIQGEARLTRDRGVIVTRPDGTAEELNADVILIATGSRPRHPPEVPFDDPDVMDSEQVFELDEPFGSLLVVGGTPIGCEYASIFAAAGAEVTLVDRSDRLLKALDEEMSHALADAFTKLGMRVVLGGGRRPAIERDDRGLRVTLGNGEVVRPDKVFYSAGRTGNVEELGLEEVGVALDAKRRVIVDDRFETNVPRIYAAGDVIGPPSLASVSMEQGRVAICHAFGISLKDTVDPLAPLAIYSIPEAAMVGETEASAAAGGIDYAVGRHPFERNTRATISGATEGLVKLIFERDSLRVIGVHIVAEDASELIHVGQAVIQFEGTLEYFIHGTFAVPTLTDAYKYAAYDGLTQVGR